MKNPNIENLISQFDLFYTDLKKVDFSSLKLNENNIMFDGYNLYRNNQLNDLIDRFKYGQSHFYKLLTMKENTFFYAVIKSKIPIIGDYTRFGIIINQIPVYIKYNPCENNGKYIPYEIMNTWLHYCSRWNIAEESVLNVIKTRLPSLLLMPLHSIIAGFENKKNITKNSEFLEQKFNYAFRRAYGDERYFDKEKYFELRCLLDTRANEDYSKSGFQLFVSSHNNERNVYVIPNADVTKIQLLDNAADAIDSYAAHLFSRKEGEFDFWQYAKDF